MKNTTFFAHPLRCLLDHSVNLDNDFSGKPYLNKKKKRLTTSDVPNLEG